MTVTDEKQLAAYIDHTLLSATTTSEDIKRLCREAVEFGFHSVSVTGRWVGLAAEELHNTGVKVGGVVSLPLGSDTTKAKVASAKDLIFAGADEIDMVADIAAIIEGNSKYLLGQLHAMLRICHSMRPKVLLKVIIESAALTFDQKLFACRVVEKAGADFIKTSTGMNPAGGAAVEDVKLMKEMAPNCKVKAAGGIRTYTQAMEMIEAGAERIGTSSGVQIIKEFKAG